MKYEFSFEYLATGTKKRHEIEANSFREARNIFFEAHQNSNYKLDFIWEKDDCGNYIKKLK